MSRGMRMRPARAGFAALLAGLGLAWCAGVSGTALAAEPASRFGETVKRLNAFREAGADSLFAPGVTDAAAIAALVREVHGPLNVLATRGTPPIGELEQMGVRRVSLGSGPARAALTVMRRIGRELLERGTYTSFTEGVMTYVEANRLFDMG